MDDENINEEVYITELPVMAPAVLDQSIIEPQ
jgi:hypothetical protein